jgi:hypothetical protein
MYPQNPFNIQIRTENAGTHVYGVVVVQFVALSEQLSERKQLSCAQLQLFAWSRAVYAHTASSVPTRVLYPWQPFCLPADLAATSNDDSVHAEQLSTYMRFVPVDACQPYRSARLRRPVNARLRPEPRAMNTYDLVPNSIEHS